jgi:hypothetical protein
MEIGDTALSVDLFADHFVARFAQHRPRSHALPHDACLGPLDGPVDAIGIFLQREIR